MPIGSASERCKIAHENVALCASATLFRFGMSGVDVDVALAQFSQHLLGDPPPIPTLDEMCAAYVARVVEASNGNRSVAARALGINRSTVNRYLAKAARR